MAAQAALTYPECRQSCKSSDIDMDEIKEKAKKAAGEAAKVGKEVAKEAVKAGKEAARVGKEVAKAAVAGIKAGVAEGRKAYEENKKNRDFKWTCVIDCAGKCKSSMCLVLSPT